MENNSEVDRGMVLTDMFLKFHELECPELRGGLAVFRFFNSYASEDALQRAIDEEIEKGKNN